MDHGHGRRTGAILGVAAGGLLLGHWLTYLVEVPDAHARAGVLAASGHGYLGVAAQISAIVAAACVAMVFLGRLTRRDPGCRSDRPPPGSPSCKGRRSSPWRCSSDSARAPTSTT